MLNKMSVSELAELSNLSKPYISQVKSGKRPPAQKLLQCLKCLHEEKTKGDRDYLRLFLQSREMSRCSEGTMRFYTFKLGKFFSEVNPDKATPGQIERFLLQFDNAGNRHAYFRAIRTFYNWRLRSFRLASPMANLTALKMRKLIMPALEKEDV